MGIYISVPFCRTKCSFCNFASGVFSRTFFDRYIEQLCSDIAAADCTARQLGCELDRRVDSIYLGGGTPSVLAPDQLVQIFAVLRESFEVEGGAEITVECAPGTIGADILEALLQSGVNRVSLGVQSFIDQECSSVGRLHTRAVTLDDIARLRAAGIGNINIDLIAGLPHQTAKSWQLSLSETLSTGVPHVSVYMLEVDEDSRLGNELLAGGSRYHAHFVPDDDLTADLYLAACERLELGGVKQYEISNFARPVTHGMGLWDSRHNLKYWQRRPYIGFGVDAHSMLTAGGELQAKGVQAVRFATPDSLEGFSTASPPAGFAALQNSRTFVVAHAALEESFFLGLRLNRGVSLPDLSHHFGPAMLAPYQPIIDDLRQAELLEETSGCLRLTARGRLLSNEVFERFLKEDVAHHRDTEA